MSFSRSWLRGAAVAAALAAASSCPSAAHAALVYSFVPNYQSGDRFTFEAPAAIVSGSVAPGDMSQPCGFCRSVSFSTRAATAGNDRITIDNRPNATDRYNFVEGALSGPGTYSAFEGVAELTVALSGPAQVLYSLNVTLGSTGDSFQYLSQGYAAGTTVPGSQINCGYCATVAFTSIAGLPEVTTLLVDNSPNASDYYHFPGSLAAPGIYADTNDAGTLTITDTEALPEPGMLPAFAIGLAALCATRRRAAPRAGGNPG